MPRILGHYTVAAMVFLLEYFSCPAVDLSFLTLFSIYITSMDSVGTIWSSLMTLIFSPVSLRHKEWNSSQTSSSLLYNIE